MPKAEHRALISALAEVDLAAFRSEEPRDRPMTPYNGDGRQLPLPP